MSTDSKGAFPRLIVTAGEPAGIGPDLCLWLSTQSFPAYITIAADLDALKQRALSSALIDEQYLRFIEGPATEPHTAGQLAVIDHPCTTPPQAGVLNSENAQQVLSTLDTAMQGCEQGQASGPAG